MIETKQEKIRALRAETLYTLVEKIDQWIVDNDRHSNLEPLLPEHHGERMIAALAAMRESGTDIVECLGAVWQAIKNEESN